MAGVDMKQLSRFEGMVGGADLIAVLSSRGVVSSTVSHIGCFQMWEVCAIFTLMHASKMAEVVWG